MNKSQLKTTSPTHTTRPNKRVFLISHRYTAKSAIFLVWGFNPAQSPFTRLPETGFSFGVNMNLTQLSHRDQFPIYLSEINPNAVMVELGVYRGDHLAKYAERLPRGHCYGVDSWLDHLQGRERTTPTDKSAEGEREATHRFASVANVTLIKSDTVTAADRFADESLDFVYIDADHTFEGCHADLMAWYPKVKSGGIIAGHDYMTHVNSRVKFGVIEAVTVFAKHYKLQVHITKDHPPSWIAVKP